MFERQVLPMGLAQLPPGPVLARALALIDRSRLTSSDLYTVVGLLARQVSHDTALLLSAVLTAACDGLHGGDELVGDRVAAGLARLDGFSGAQLAFELCWSRQAMQAQVGLAQALIEDLPDVYASLLAGRIDLVRARAFVDVLGQLPLERARQVAARFLVKAESWTVGQLRERLRYWALKADPGLARRRARRSVADRRVFTDLDNDGTATLGGVGLPVDQAAAAANRLHRLAKAAKAEGDARTLQQLQADAMLALLCGAPFTLQPPADAHTASADAEARAETEARVAAQARVVDLPDVSGQKRDAGQDSGLGRETGAGREAGAGQEGGEAGDGPGTAPGFTPSGRGATMDSLLRFARPEADAGGDRTPNAGAADAGPPDAPGLEPDTDLEPAAEPDPGPGYQYSEPYDPIGAGGLFDEPLPIRTSDGRIDLDRNSSPDQANRCVCGGVIPAPRRGAVDLTMKLTTLMCLDDDPALIPGWGPVISDIARQVAHDQDINPQWKWSVTDNHGRLLHHGHTNRRPTAAEQAFVKARDRTCRAPGCRRAAMWCDEDHLQERVNGGPSHRGNLCSSCKFHHRLRHERGFVIHPIESGTYMWQAPNKRLYLVLPDGNLLLAADDCDPPPPPGHVRAAFGNPTDEEWFGEP